MKPTNPPSTATSDNASAAPLPNRHIFAIALPNFGQDLMRGPGTTIIQGIYATQFGLDLATLATILLISKIFDAITDPAVGLLSDRYFHRHGTRKPWLGAGTVVSLLGMWLLYHPSGEVDAVKFTALYLLTYLGWTLAEIPYGAWKAEVTQNYKSRTHIAAMDTLMGLLGGISFSLVPIIMNATGQIDGVAHTIETIHVTAIIALVVLPILVFIAVTRVPDGMASDRQSQPSLRETLAAIRGNGPVLYFILLSTLTGFTGGLGGGLSYIYIVRYLDAADLFVYMGLVLTPVMLVVVPLAAWVANRFGKHRIYAIALTVLALSAGGTDLLVDHTDPNNAQLHSQFGLLLLLVLSSSVVIMMAVAQMSLVGDMVDFGQWKFGANHAGVYFTAIALCSKLTAAISTAMGLYLVSAFGFEASMDSAISERAQFGLRLVFSWLPIGLTLLVLPLVFRYPLTPSRHAIVVKALQRRARHNEGRRKAAMQGAS